MGVIPHAPCLQARPGFHPRCDGFMRALGQGVREGHWVRFHYLLSARVHQRFCTMRRQSSTFPRILLRTSSTPAKRIFRAPDRDCSSEDPHIIPSRIRRWPSCPQPCKAFPSSGVLLRDLPSASCSTNERRAVGMWGAGGRGESEHADWVGRVPFPKRMECSPELRRKVPRGLHRSARRYPGSPRSPVSPQTLRLIVFFLSCYGRIYLSHSASLRNGLDDSGRCPLPSDPALRGLTARDDGCPEP